MTRHLDEGALQALLDDELLESEEHASREHLAACPTCRQRFAEAREANHLLANALTLLDPPLTDGSRLVRTAPPSTARRSARWYGTSPLRAAAMVLFFAAAASATIPGSPLREWLTGDSETPPAASAGGAATRTEAAPAEPVRSGVSVLPAEGAFEVRLTGGSPRLIVRATLVDGSRGAVYASGDAADASFATSPGSVTVASPGAGELWIEIPRTAASATVLLEGEPVLLKEGGRLRLLPGTAGAASEIRVEVVP